MESKKESEDGVWSKLKHLRELEETGTSDIDEVVFEAIYDSSSSSSSGSVDKGDDDHRSGGPLKEDVFDRLRKMREEEGSDVDEVVGDWGLDSDDDSGEEGGGEEGEDKEGGAEDDDDDDAGADEANQGSQLRTDTEEKSDGDALEVEGGADAAQRRKKKNKNERRNARRKLAKKKKLEEGGERDGAGACGSPPKAYATNSSGGGDDDDNGDDEDSSADSDGETSRLASLAQQWETSHRQTEDFLASSASNPALASSTTAAPGLNQQLSVYVSQLDYHATQADVEDFFSSAGVTPTSVRLVYDRNDGNSFKGVAFVDVPSAEQLARALALDKGEGPNGRKVNVRPTKTGAELAGIVRRREEVSAVL